MNQAGLQWRIETNSKVHQKEGYVSNENCLNGNFLSLNRDKSLKLVATTPSRGQSRDGIVNGGGDGTIRGVPLLTTLNKVSFE